MNTTTNPYTAAILTVTDAVPQFTEAQIIDAAARLATEDGVPTSAFPTGALPWYAEHELDRLVARIEATVA